MDPTAAAARTADGGGENSPSPVAAEAWLATRWTLLLAAAARVLTCPEDVAEAANDAAYRVWRGWARYDAARGSRESWAYAVARNAAIDRRRRLRGAALTRLVETMPLSAPWLSDTRQAADEQEACDRADDRARLVAVWPRLTARERGYIVRLARGSTYASIARADRTPVGTVKTRVRLMRSRLSRLTAEGASRAG